MSLDSSWLVPRASRSVEPVLGIFILNRYGPLNFNRPITCTTELDMQGKVIMINDDGEGDGERSSFSLNPLATYPAPDLTSLCDLSLIHI